MGNDKSKKSAKKSNSNILLGIGIGIILLLSYWLYYIASMQPFSAFGGAIWLKQGVHYISDTEIASKAKEINAPQEAALEEKIKATTLLCDNISDGYCQKAPGDYYTKSLTASAIAYVPGTPDKKQLIGYCTACNDGSMSPSCAVGRGACSWHDGVAAYNVPQYNIIPGKPAIPAKPAVYSYINQTYKDSPNYKSPDMPTLNTIIGY